MSILVTGGAGYIGSHTCVELCNAGFDVAVVDNLCNSSQESLHRVEKITGKKISFYQIDILDKEGLSSIFEQESIEAVIHFAGLKAVGESVDKPLKYYHNNVAGTIVLLEVMAAFGVKNLVFSSSATVYGEPKEVPIKEDVPLSTMSPYGRTKLMIEDMLRDLFTADRDWKIFLLRYFNPIGAHESGMIGEDPSGIPNNLMPYITQVAVGKLDKLGVFGDDYDTPDGTCVRDYIHVVDLSVGHVKAIEKIKEVDPGVYPYNLGTGTGYSVLDIVKAFGKVLRRELPYEIKPRRAGDVPICYADSSKAKEELGFTAQYGIEKMCEDSLRWQLKNPKGYE